MTELLTNNPLLAIRPPEDPEIGYLFALYALPAGHYLFRAVDHGRVTAKIVTARDVAAAFSGTEEDSGWLPAGVVRAGANACGRWFVYSTPPQKAQVIFEGDDAPLVIPLPRLVLVGVGSKYYLWALKGTHFDPGARACEAPFPNVHDGGEICWGTSTPPAADPARARKPWELFFATPFSSHLAAGKSLTERGDVRVFLRTLAGKREYPNGDLIELPGQSTGSKINTILGVH